MFAVIRSGGKQHRVSENDRLAVDRLAGNPGDSLTFNDILMVAGDGAAPLVGKAVPEEACVFAELVAQTRGPKILVFKKKRRKNHRRLNGHRQEMTLIRIRAVSLSGEPPAADSGSGTTAATDPAGSSAGPAASEE